MTTITVHPARHPQSQTHSPAQPKPAGRVLDPAMTKRIALALSTSVPHPAPMQAAEQRARKGRGA